MKNFMNWNHFELHVSFPEADLPKVLQWMDGSYRVHCFDNIHSSGYTVDMMTSETVQCSNAEAALVRLNERVKDLEEDGVKVLRKKIETVPWFDEPHFFVEHTTNLYMETHLKIYGHPYKIGQGLLISKDKIKKTTIATLRTHADFEFHINELHASIARLAANGTYVVGKPDTELVIFDSNIDHDREWTQ